MPIDNPDPTLYTLVGVAAVFVVFFLMIGFASFVKKFYQELQYLNREICRTEGAERRYWIRKRRRLWLSLIPFVKYR